MAAQKRYNFDYQVSNTARKTELPNKNPNPLSYKEVKINKNTKRNAKSELLTIIWIVAVFAMLMILVYRFNVINAKNLQVQSLKKEMLTAQGILASSQIEVEQSIDLNKIEADAKQKLGMQKPSQSQLIYIDNSTSNSVYSNETTTIIDKVIDKLKELKNNMF